MMFCEKISHSSNFNGWESRRLDEICEFLDYRRKPVKEPDRHRRVAGKSQADLYPYYGANGQAGWIDDYLFDEKLILLAEDGGPFGSERKPIAYAVEGKCWVNNHAHVLRPRAGVDFDFCLYALSIRPDVGKLVTGNTRPKLNQSLAASIPMPTPPLAEQRRIAKMIKEQFSAAGRLRAAISAQLDAAQALPASYLREMVASDGAKTWPLRPLGDICRIVARQVNPTHEQYRDLPHINGENIESGTCRLLWLRTASQDRMTSNKYLFEKGDILYSKLRPYLRKVVVAPCRGVCSADMYPIVVDSTVVDAQFVAWLLLSDAFTEYADEQSRRARMPKLNREQLFAWCAPLPPLEEQRSLVATLQKQTHGANSLDVSLREQLEYVNNLPPAILRRAFDGGI